MLFSMKTINALSSILNLQFSLVYSANSELYCYMYIAVSSLTVRDIEAVIFILTWKPTLQ